MQDQDTVALQRPPDGSHPRVTSFTWEFHPVLGEHVVRSGLKQTFVQIALPTLANIGCFGRIKVHTYWRRFDQKTGTAGPVITESVLASANTFPIPSLDLTPPVGTIGWEDLGDGTVRVSIQAESGSYLAGTYVQLGPNRYDAGKNLTMEDTSVKFVAPITVLARWKPYLAARNGAQADIAYYPTPLNPPASCATPAAAAAVAPPPAATTTAAPTRPPSCETVEISSLTVTPLNETDSRLRIDISTSVIEKFQQQLLVEIGGKVYGLRDAPVKREPGPVITVVVPTASLVANPVVRVFRPFWNDAQAGVQTFRCGYDIKRLATFDQDSATERLVLVSVASSGDSTYILYGNGLSSPNILVPTTGATVVPVDSVPPGTIALLTITKAALDTTKKIVQQKNNGERPLILDIPDPKAAPPKVTVDSPVIQNTDELNLSAEKAADIKSVSMGKTTLKWKPVDDSTIRLLNLKVDGVTIEQKTQTITVQYKNGVKVNVTLEVVAARIGVKQN